MTKGLLTSVALLFLAAATLAGCQHPAGCSDGSCASGCSGGSCAAPSHSTYAAPSHDQGETVLHAAASSHTPAPIGSGSR